MAAKGPENSPKSRRLHWVAPMSMLGALAAGLLFTIGHHLFYSSLDRTPVSTSPFIGTRISKQEFNTAAGTAFAFVVRACLVAAISVAFVQLFWKTVKSSGTSLLTLDAIFSGVTSFSSLTNVVIWSRYPLLLTVALVAWLVPIASIFTPAALSIQVAHVARSSNKTVPNLDFGSFSFVAPMPEQFQGSYEPAASETYDYSGSSEAVLQITNAVMSTGGMLAIQPPQWNTTWTLHFWGPSLQCNDIDEALRQKIAQNIATCFGPLGFEVQPAYLAWLSRASNSTDPDIGYLPNISGDSCTFDPGSLMASNMPLELLITITNATLASSYQQTSLLDAIMFKCRLFNASYNVSFNYTENLQNIQLELPVENDERRVTLAPRVSSIPTFEGGHYSPCGLLASADLPSQLPVLSYQAVTQAFLDNVLGTVYTKVSHPNIVSYYSSLNISSNVLQTALSRTPQLSFLRSAASTLPLQSVIQACNEERNKGLVNTRPNLLDIPIKQAIEELFHNVTMSFMSSDALQPNYTSLSAPSPVSVTHHRSENIYVYSALRLWLAYGIAICVTSLCILLGLATMILDGVTYSNAFSTVFRNARGAEMNAESISAEDLDGTDPLPEKLAKARVFFGGLDSYDGGGEEEKNSALGRPMSNATSVQITKGSSHSRLLSRSSEHSTGEVAPDQTDAFEVTTMQALSVIGIERAHV